MPYGTTYILGGCIVLTVNELWAYIVGGIFIAMGEFYSHLNAKIEAQKAAKSN